MNGFKHYSACFFDLYGTLVDIHTREDTPKLWKTMADWYNAHGGNYSFAELRQAYRDNCQREEKALQERQRMKGLCVAEAEIDIGNVFASLFQGRNCSADDAEVREAAILFRKTSLTHLRLYRHARELLKAVRDSGSRVVLLSNAQSLFTRWELEMLGIDTCFDAIYLSSEWGVKKPDPLFYSTALRDQALKPEECLMTGNDWRCDIEGSRAAGMDQYYIHTHLSPKEDSGCLNLEEATYVQDRQSLLLWRKRMLQGRKGDGGRSSVSTV